jgi:putative phage-type endonuclease
MKITNYETRDDWLKSRADGIGASEGAAVMNASPFQSEYALWAEKAGFISRRDINADNADLGHEIEPVAAKMFQKRTGLPVLRLGDFSVMRDEEWPWLFVTHDYLTEDADRGLGVIECKAVSGGAAAMWSNGPPLYYQIQIQQEMLVSRATWGVFAVVFGGPSWRFEMWEQEINPKFCTTLVERTKRFWQMVIDREPPDIDESERTEAALRLRYDNVNKTAPTSVELPPEFEWLDRERQTLKGMVSRAEKRIKGIDNKIRAGMGSSDIGLIDGRPTYSNKLSGSSRRLLRLGDD